MVVLCVPITGMQKRRCWTFVSLGAALGGRSSLDTYPLAAAAVKKDWSIRKSSSLSWAVMTAGWKTPDATRAAPNATPVNKAAAMVPAKRDTNLNSG